MHLRFALCPVGTITRPGPLRLRSARDAEQTVVVRRIASWRDLSLVARSVRLLDGSDLGLDLDPVADNILGGIELFAKSGFFAIGGAFGFIGPLASLLWILAASVVLLRPASGASATS